MRFQPSGVVIATAISAMFSVDVAAAPLVLDRSEAVGDVRSDVGTGLCGSVVKFAKRVAFVVTIDEAVAILDKPGGDPEIVGRVSRIFPNMNFSTGIGSGADFQAPSYSEDPVPYSQAPNALPMGADGNNIAMRLRGYLNVTNATGGQPVTFAVKVDDACAVRIGKSRQLVMLVDRNSSPVTALPAYNSATA